MKKIICSPGKYVQGKGEINNLPDYAESFGCKGAYVIIGKNVNGIYGDKIEESFKNKGITFKKAVFGGECSMAEINKHCDNLGECNVVIGIGGGKTLDTSKAVSYFKSVPVIIVPTAASSDAPCSRLSVIYSEDGVFEKYLPLSENPNVVMMDTEIIANAPARFLAAGIGDALATYYEADACRRANALSVVNGHTTNSAMKLAELCKEILFSDGLKAMTAVKNKVCTAALENIIEANTYLSGVGFESCGLAAAHAIHNGLTAIPETHKLLHGEKVAFGTIVQLVLENKPLDEIMEIIYFCHDMGLPVNFEELNIKNISDEKLMEAAAISCAESDTMHNMPFEVTAEDVFAAMKTADSLSSSNLF